MDMRKIQSRESNGIVIANPPYGERIAIRMIHKNLCAIKRDSEKDPTWSLIMITTDRGVEKIFDRKS